MNAGERILRSPHVALAPAEDGYLAYDLETAQLHKLNLAAALIIELSNGTATAEDVCAQVAPIVADASIEGCAAWVETARKDGLIKTLAPDDPLPPSKPPQDFVERADELRKQGYVLAAFTCQHYATFLQPDDSENWYALGELAFIVGRRDEAREAYEQYLKLSPDDAEIEQILVALRDEAPPPRASNRCIEQLYSRFAEHYEESMCGKLSYQGPTRLAEALDAQLGSATDLDVLELGCGTGLAGKYLRTKARRLTAIDLSPDMVDHAQKTGIYDSLAVAEITDWLSRADGDFDLIAACDTLIYFGDLSQVIVPASKRLRKGGRIAFTVERGNNPPYKLTDSGRFSHTAEHIRAVAEQAGLSVASLTEGFLRFEYGEDVIGLVAVLQRR